MEVHAPIELSLAAQALSMGRVDYTHFTIGDCLRTGSGLRPDPMPVRIVFGATLIYS